MEWLKKILLLIGGYVLFIIIIAGLESIIVTTLGMESHIVNNLEENTKYTLSIYIGLNILFWGINYIYNFKMVEKLNKLLDKVKEREIENIEKVIEDEK